MQRAVRAPSAGRLEMGECPLREWSSGGRTGRAAGRGFGLRSRPGVPCVGPQLSRGRRPGGACLEDPDLSPVDHGKEYGLQTILQQVKFSICRGL